MCVLIKYKTIYGNCSFLYLIEQPIANQNRRMCPLLLRHLPQEVLLCELHTQCYFHSHMLFLLGLSLKVFAAIEGAALTAPNTQISGAVYIKGGSKSNTFEYTTAIYTTLFSLAITLYQQPAFHFFPTLLLFLSYSVSYLSNPRSTHLYSDPYSIPG